MPRLTEDYQRVIILKYYQKDPPHFDIVLFVKYILMLCEVMMRYDCKLGSQLIIDHTNASLSNIAKLTPTALKQCIAIIQVYLPCNSGSI